VAGKRTKRARKCAVAECPESPETYPEFVIPAKAGIHLDLVLLFNRSKIKGKMDPSFRWDDVAVLGGSRLNQNPETTNPPFGGFVLKALDPRLRGDDALAKPR
jgi:hypothetical protein